MSDLPILNLTIDQPKVLGWFYQVSGFLGDTVTISRSPLPYEKVSSFEKVGTVTSGQAVSLNDANSFATSAVFAEQDLVTEHLDKIAAALNFRTGLSDESKQLANDVLDELASLRKLVNRGRAGQGFWDNPNWWNRGDEVDPALMLMRSALLRR